MQLTTRAPNAEWQPEQTSDDGSFAFQVAREVLPVSLTVEKKGFQTTEKVFSSVPAGVTDVCLQPTMR